MGLLVALLMMRSVWLTPLVAAQALSLEVGVVLERELAGGQSHTYSLTLEAGQYFRGVVEQRGIDVAVSIVSPNSKTVLEVDSPNGTQGPEGIQ